MTGQIERTDDGNFAAKHYRIPGEKYFESMTALFRYQNVLNAAKSQAEGRPVYDTKEVVQFKLVGDKTYSPVFPVDATYRTVNGRVITFAERWKEQYTQFLEGDAQVAAGTPLEELKPYGMTPAQLSICVAMGIHSIEALDQAEGQARKRLGQHGNDLKPMARRWMEARATALGGDNAAELAELRATVARLEAAAGGPVVMAAPVTIPTDEYAEFTDSEIKDKIEAAAGARPRGNPSRDTLLSMIRDLET